MEIELAGRREPHQQVIAANTGSVRVYSSTSACREPPCPRDVGGIRVVGTTGSDSLPAVPSPGVPVATHVKVVKRGQHM